MSKRLENEEEKAKFTKKEIGLWFKEKQKLEALYGGIYNMKQKPDLLFIIDTHLEDLVVRETIKENVKTVGIVDTNANPEVVDYPIPANDDATGSIKLIMHYIIDAWIEGKNIAKKREKKASERKETVEAKVEAVKKTKKTESKKDLPAARLPDGQGKAGESKIKTDSKKSAVKKSKIISKKVGG